MYKVLDLTRYFILMVGDTQTLLKD